MIARMWRGETRSKDSDEYLAYLHKTGIPDYRATAGNKGVFVLRRIDQARAHFLLLTFWESLDAIKAFAGEDIERARYYAEDEKFLLQLRSEVEHFEVV